MNPEAETEKVQNATTPLELDSRLEQWVLAELKAIAAIKGLAVDSALARNELVNKPKINTLFEILKYIFDLDQADRYHSRGAELYQKLKPLEEHFIGTEAENQYFYQLGFEAFHAAQNLALTGGDREEVLNWLKICQVETAKAKLPAPDLWGPYIAGTKAYFENNPTVLRRIVRNFPPTADNYKILKNLLSGLDKHSRIDYARDYSRY